MAAWITAQSHQHYKGSLVHNHQQFWVIPFFHPSTFKQSILLHFPLTVLYTTLYHCIRLLIQPLYILKPSIFITSGAFLISMPPINVLLVLACLNHMANKLSSSSNGDCFRFFLPLEKLLQCVLHLGVFPSCF